MRPLVPATAAITLLASFVPLRADPFVFDADPFAGSTALTTPGRQVVGGETSITFSIASDVFLFDPTVFGVEDLRFANAEIGSLPPAGANTIVLRTLDDDGDPGTPFGAGAAANLIAAQITDPGPGFFVYFNGGLDLPRLVFSTDLSDDTADLKILARLTNLAGQPESLSGFSEGNFSLVATPVPEPGTLSLLALGGSLWLCRRRRPRKGLLRA